MLLQGIFHSLGRRVAGMGVCAQLSPFFRSQFLLREEIPR